MLEQCCNYSKQCRNNVATLCCAKNRCCGSSRVTSPLSKFFFILINDFCKCLLFVFSAIKWKDQNTRSVLPFFPPKGIKLEDEKRRGSIVRSVVHCFCYLELVYCRNQSFSFTLIYGQAGCMNKVSWFLFLDYDNRSPHRGDYSNKWKAWQFMKT